VLTQEVKNMKERKVAGQVGAAIAARRKAKGLTQAQIAEAIGVEKETVSRMENGVISLTLQRLQQMSRCLIARSAIWCAQMPRTPIATPRTSMS
jgi:transcriptional regulator with XRE-family HTH domain